IRTVLADLALMARAPDAERLNRDIFRNNVAPAFGSFWFLPESARPRYAYWALQRGDVATSSVLLDEAEQAALQALKQGIESPAVSVELAAVRALQHDNDGAMEWLQRAYDNGWRVAWPTRLDPMLENLHSDNRFVNLIARM